MKAILVICIMIASSQLMASPTMLTESVISDTSIMVDENHTVSKNYLFIEPGTKTIIIDSKAKDFSNEATTFRSHRYHYIAFWGLFFLMRATQW